MATGAIGQQDHDPAAGSQHVSIRDLHAFLDGHFDLDELRTFCEITLGVDFEHLSGGTLPAKITSLIIYMEKKERLAELAAAAYAQASTPSRKRVRQITLSQELREYLGLWRQCQLWRANRAIATGRIVDKRVHEMLEKVRQQLDSIRQHAEDFDNPALPALAERLSRKLGSGTTERYKLCSAVPMIPMILDAPERTALPGTEELQSIWHELLRLGKWAPYLVLAVVVPIIWLGVRNIYDRISPNWQDHEIGDDFSDGTTRGYKLDSDVWDAGSAGHWSTPDLPFLYLKIEGPGVALLRTDGLRDGTLTDFDFRFNIAFDNQTPACAVIRARGVGNPPKLNGYAFCVDQAASGAVMVDGKVLPDGRKLHANRHDLYNVLDFDPNKDKLQVTIHVEGSEFTYTAIQSPRTNQDFEREHKKGYGYPSKIIFDDSQQKAFQNGTAGFWSEAPGGTVRITMVSVDPAWRRFPFRFLR